MDFLKKKASILFKRTALLLLIGLSLSAFPAHAQSQGIQLPFRQMTVEQALKEIERQTGFGIVANLDKLNISRSVVFNGMQGSVDEILQQVLAGTGQSYSFRGRYIVIVPPAEEPQRAPAVAQTVAPAPVSTPPVAGIASLSGFEQELKELEARRAMAVSAVLPEEQAVLGGTFRYQPTNLTLRQTERASYTQPAVALPKFSIKTNLLYGAVAMAPNLSFEIGLGPKTSLDLFGSYNPWNLKGSHEDNKKMVHWIAKPEFRYWLCERFNGHFFGAHLLYSNYNVGGYDIPLLFDKEYRYEGNAFGGGVSYGYHLMLSERWGAEFNLGVGVAVLKYDKKSCPKCGTLVDNLSKTYFGPTSFGIKLVYVIK